MISVTALTVTGHLRQNRRSPLQGMLEVSSKESGFLDEILQAKEEELLEV